MKSKKRITRKGHDQEQPVAVGLVPEKRWTDATWNYPTSALYEVKRSPTGTGCKEPGPTVGRGCPKTETHSTLIDSLEAELRLTTNRHKYAVDYGRPDEEKLWFKVLTISGRIDSERQRLAALAKCGFTA